MIALTVHCDSVELTTDDLVNIVASIRTSLNTFKRSVEHAKAGHMDYIIFEQKVIELTSLNKKLTSLVE